MATPSQQAMSGLTEKQQKQAKAALAAKKAGKAIGPGQRAALKEYNKLLVAAGGKPRYGIGAGKKPQGGGAAGGGGGGGNAGSGGNAGGGGRDPDDGGTGLEGTVFEHKNIDDIIKDDALLEKALRAAGLQGEDLEELKKQALLGYQFGGLNQYIYNQSGRRDEVANSPWLQNVGMDNDQNAWRRIVGQIMGDLSDGVDPSIVWSERLTRMNEQMPYLNTAYDKLKEQGIGFSLELLADPNLNLTDPSKPLFEFGKTHPTSLHQLTGFQAGEEAFYAGLTAEELLTQIYPTYSQYYNRPAGEPAPPELAGGMMFGGYNPNTGAIGGAFRENATNPGNDLYMRAMAYGMLDPMNPGRVGGDAGPFGPTSSYYPLTGGGTALPSFPGNQRWAQDFLSGALQPEYFHDPAAYYDMAQSVFGRIGMAAFTGDPSYWFSGQYAPYANIDEDTRNRYTTLMGYY